MVTLRSILACSYGSQKSQVLGNRNPPLMLRLPLSDDRAISTPRRFSVSAIDSFSVTTFVKRRRPPQGHAWASKSYSPLSNIAQSSLRTGSPKPLRARRWQRRLRPVAVLTKPRSPQIRIRWRLIAAPSIWRANTTKRISPDWANALGGVRHSTQRTESTGILGTFGLHALWVDSTAPVSTSPVIWTTTRPTVRVHCSLVVRRGTVTE